MNPIFSVASIFLAVFFLSGPSAQAQIYKYIDKKGNVHFTDRFEAIPPEYREQIKTIQVPPPPVPAQPGQRREVPPEKEGPPKDKLVEELKKEEAAKAAQAKAEEQEKLKARKEKIKKMEEIRKQIEEKDKEAKSLRTNWMVHDRYTLIRMNQEKEVLVKEYHQVQEELDNLK